MRTNRTARLDMPSLGFGLCVALLSGCLSTPMEDVFFELPKGWKIGHADRNREKVVTVFVRPGESVQNWTEQLTIQSFSKAYYSMPFRTFMDVTKEIPGSTVTLISEEPTSIMFEMHLRVDGDAPDEHGIWRVLDGQRNRFVITYTVRGAVKMTPSRRTEWIDRFSGAVLRLRRTGPDSLAGFAGERYLGEFHHIEMSQRTGVKRIPTDPGPCDVCGEPSEAKQQRRTLSNEGRLRMEFCSRECARKFYSNPFWRSNVGKQ